MQLSEARLAANKANAARSSGPRTAAGKEKSRANAYKHGLCATVVVSPEEAEALRNTPGAGTLGGWLLEQVVLDTGRIDRCRRSEDAIRERITARARLTWDQDRQLDAIKLAEKLDRDPETIVGRLRETLHGVDWLLAKWTLLARAAKVQNAWTPEQSRLALNLAGLSPEFHQGYELTANFDLETQKLHYVEDLPILIRREVDDLKARRVPLVELDKLARKQAEAGLSAESDAEFKRHRRYESTLLNRLRWAVKQLEQAAAAIEPQNEPNLDEELGAEPPRPETTDRMDFLNRSASRVEKKLQKADLRREARLRKLEKLRS